MQKPVKRTAREQTQLARAVKALEDFKRWKELSEMLQQGKTDGEIAGELGITKNAVKKRRHRHNQQVFGRNTSCIGGSGKRWGWRC
jgi:DNA-binding NarL/FixJ family response regulator